MKHGGFTFVLHSHLPYCRQAGRWPHGEEWIHEAGAETYIPILNALYDLRADNVPFRLTIGITPILTEQLADPLILKNFEEYLQEKIEAASKDIERFSSQTLTKERDEALQVAKKEKALAIKQEKEKAAAETKAATKVVPEPIEAEAEPLETTAAKPTTPIVLKGKAALEAAADIKKAATQELASSEALDPDFNPQTPQEITIEPVIEDVADSEPVPAEQRHYLAMYYRDWYANILETFTNRYDRNIVGAFKTLQDEGLIEIITCAATHGYLPLVARDSTIYAQLATAVQSYEMHYGRRPRAIWLPECAYRPSYYGIDENGQQYLKPGIEDFLAEQGISLFFSETHTIEGGVPVGKAADENIIGPYSYISRRYVVPAAQVLPKTNNTTFQPYWVVRPDVAVMGRNNRTGMQVWSSDWGYPGDKDYREFHSKDSGSGMQYWRITGSKIELGQKEFYHPEWTTQRVREHADHFVSLVESQLKEYYETHNKVGLIACNYDTELFGHWWFEGVEWLREVLRRLAYSETVEITTASNWLQTNPPEIVMAIPEGSWGQQGTHHVWQNEENDWMWKPIHAAENRMEKLVEKFGSSEAKDVHFVLQQAARELLLLESSDWPFLITTGQANDYATERFDQHTSRFNQLADGLEAGDGTTVSADVLEIAQQFYDLDNPFPMIEPQVFAYREQISR